MKPIAISVKTNYIRDPNSASPKQTDLNLIKRLVSPLNFDRFKTST